MEKKLIKYLILSTLIVVPVIFFPTYNMYSTPKWLTIYITLTLASFFALTSNVRFYVPVFPKFVTLAIISLVALYISTMIATWPGYYFFPVMHWVGFFLVAFFSYNTIRLSEGAFSGKWIIIPTLPVISLAMLQIFNFHPIIGTWLSPVSNVISSLGNPNFLAFFLSISILVQIFQFRRVKGYFQLLLLIVSTFVILKTTCRSALVALTVSVCFTYIPISFNKKLLASLILLVGLISAGHFYNKLNGNARLSLWVNSGYMIADNPLLGVGPNKFVSSYGKYHNNFKKYRLTTDTVVESHPHNAYIETMVENGIPFLVILMIVLIALFVKIYRDPHVNSKSLFISIFIFLSINVFFTFSLQRPTIYYFTAFFLGQTLRLDLNRYRLPLNFKYAFLIPVVVFSYLVYSKYLSHRNFYKYGGNLPAVKQSCSLWPVTWIFCMRQGEMEIGVKRLKAAEKTFEKIIVNYQGLYPVMGKQGIVHYFNGGKEKGCKLLNEYKNILQGKSYLDPFISKHCRSE